MKYILKLLSKGAEIVDYGTACQCDYQNEKPVSVNKEIYKELKSKKYIVQVGKITYKISRGGANYIRNNNCRRNDD